MTDSNKDIQKAMVTGAVILAAGVILDRAIKSFNLGTISKIVAVGANTLLTVRKVLTVGVEDSVIRNEDEDAYQGYSSPESSTAQEVPFLIPPAETVGLPNNQFFALTPEQMKAYESIKARQQAQGSAVEGKSFLEV